MKRVVMNVFNARLIGVLALGGVLAWSGAAMGQQSRPGAQQPDPQQVQERALVDEVYYSYHGFFGHPYYGYPYYGY
jgi:hypothetical protein